MTKIEISIQDLDGKYRATWWETKGDKLPDMLDEAILIAVDSALNKYNKQ